MRQSAWLSAIAFLSLSQAAALGRPRHDAAHVKRQDGLEGFVDPLGGGDGNVGDIGADDNAGGFMRFGNPFDNGNDGAVEGDGIQGVDDNIGAAVDVEGLLQDGNENENIGSLNGEGIPDIGSLAPVGDGNEVVGEGGLEVGAGAEGAETIDNVDNVQAAPEVECPGGTVTVTVGAETITESFTETVTMTMTELPAGVGDNVVVNNPAVTNGVVGEDPARESPPIIATGIGIVMVSLQDTRGPTSTITPTTAAPAPTADAPPVEAPVDAESSAAAPIDVSSIGEDVGPAIPEATPEPSVEEPPVPVVPAPAPEEPPVSEEPPAAPDVPSPEPPAPEPPAPEPSDEPPAADPPAAEPSTEPEPPVADETPASEAPATDETAIPAASINLGGLDGSAADGADTSQPEASPDAAPVAAPAQPDLSGYNLNSVLDLGSLG